ncbi:MAG: FecR domain-containing protein [Bacteroidales bacterium]|nr:FecR domain-containing protein [Bacteroidales bacterium]
MENGTNWELIAKFLNQEASEQESQEVEERIKTNPEYREIIESVKQTWPKNQKNEKMMEFKTDSAWGKVKDKIEQESQHQANKSREQTSPVVRIAFAPLLRIAAAILIIAGLSYAGYKVFVQPGQVNQGMVVANNDLEKTVESVLPDGSTVFLKSNGKIRYHDEESGSRVIQLDGEAFFDVLSNPERPFIVETGQARITVLGTSFSVHNDEASNQVNVFVESGKVLLSDKNMTDQSIILEPGFIGKLTLSELKKEVNRNENYLAWKSGKLVFRETELEKVIDDLNRTYSTHVIHGDTKISNCRFTGTFYNQPVDSVVQVLGTVFNLHIEKTRSEIILSDEGCQ